MKNKLTYFISRSSMFGIGFFLLFQRSGKDAWIAVILGSLLAIFVMYIYKYIKEYFQNKNIRDTLNKTKIGQFYKIIFILFYFYLAIIIIILLPMFVNSFYLLYTPKILIIIPFLFLSIYITHKDKNTLEWLSTLLWVFSIVIITIYSLFLTKYIDFNNLLPIYTTKNINILLSSFIYASITSIPQILTINYHNSFKDDLKDYLLGTISTFFIIFIIIICLGEPLIKIYSFPEYAVLKQIKILKFIENIENLSTFIWYFDLFITLSTITTNIKEIMPSKYNKIYFYLAMLIIVYIATFLIGSNYRYIITIFYTYPYILFIFFLIFVTLLIYIKRSKKLK